MEPLMYITFLYVWDGKNPAGEKFYTEIIKTKLISVNLGDNNQISELIDKININ
ncbi:MULTISPECIES: hypothetical protein [Clostridia]|uniref:hypothetical protein n=1 Tax=Clostridia TaxID=186801 RepID=UPI0018F2A486|nr:MULTISPECIES: hypothetical protein [Clostridia]